MFIVKLEDIGYFLIPLMLWFQEVCMQNEIENFEITSINFVMKDFEFELQSLCMHMTAKVHAILAPFLAFASTYSANKAFNMLA